MFAAGKAVSGAAPTDAQFNYVTMLLHGDGTNGAQNNTFVDSSTNNFTITRNGNTTQGTFSPYGSNWSNYFNGSSNLSIADNSAFHLGSGAFTIECWFYKTASGNAAAISKWNAGGSDSDAAWDLDFESGNIRGIVASGGSVTFITATEPALNTWNHVAFVRSGTTLSLFVNGNRVGTTTFSGSVNNGTQGVLVGQISPSSFGGYIFQGYISNARVVKGTAVYDPTQTTYTVPTAPLTAITNTSLLTCQSNRFIDNSTNAFSITTNGSPSVQRFSPFSPTSAYTTSVIGGSGYFDGTGDYLALPTSQTPLALGSSDFTFEAWVYRASGTGAASVFCGQSDLMTLTGSGYAFYVSSSTTSDVYIGNSNFSITSPNPSVGTWAHVAYVRTGGTYSSYLNGVRVGTRSDLGTSAVNSGSTTYPPTFGAFATGANPLNGYISDARLIKGSGGYNATSSTITIPTAPLTAVTNTSLLVTFTNAGILDNAMMNDLETVGNAQISTSVKKYGTGSLYFDGSGDWMFAPDSPSWDFGTGDFTLEGWIYPTTSSSVRVLWSAFSDSGDNGWSFELTSSDKLTFYAEGAYRVTSTGSVSANTWTHIAVSRSGSSLKLFINGTTDGTATNSTDISGSTAKLTIAATPSGTVPFTGYIDELRITKGYARYTANFTAPTAAFPDKG